MVATQSLWSPGTSSLALAGFAGWQLVPVLPGDGTFISKPAAASRSASSVYLFGRSASEGLLWQNFGVALGDGRTWNWLGWSALRTPAFWLGGVSTVAFGDRALAVAARASSPNCTQAYVRACLPPPAGSSAGPDGIWTDWVQIPGGNLIRDPALAFGDPNLFVVAQGTDEKFYLSSYRTGTPFDPSHWTAWQLIGGGPWASEPGVAARPTGRLFVAALARDGQYYLTSSPDSGASWASWNRVDSGSLRFASGPALVTAPAAAGSLSIFGTGADEQMWTSTSSDDGLTWGPFEAPPDSRLTAAPAAVSPTEGVVYTFGRGTDYEFHMDPYR
jgi:hypothetical protein